MKPHKGSLIHWSKFPTPKHGLGYVIIADFDGHPEFSGFSGHTSYVVKHNEATGEIETRNSRYTLVGPSIG